MFHSPSPASHPAQPKILIVEDESLVAMDLEWRLRNLGYVVCGRVDTADDAVRAALAERPALVLMDIHLLGESDGVDAAVRIREQSSIPVVFVTAHADDATLSRAGASEPYGYVLKPFDERELKATIEMAFYRSRAEQKLRGMERWLATTLGSIGDGVIATDTAGLITFVNPVAERLTCWSRAEAVGRHLYEVFVIKEEGREAPLTDLLQAACENGGAIYVEEGHLLHNRHGERLALNDSIAPIRNDQGQITGCVVVFRDVTARKRAERTQRRVEERMREAQRLESLGVLASGIAHDFNNLLHSILGNASLGQSAICDRASVEECLSEIVAAAHRAAYLSNQMLAYSGKSYIDPQSLDLSALARETLRLLENTVEKNASLALDAAADLPRIVGDHAKLQQVILNLVANGVEALDGQPGRIKLATRLFPADRAFLDSCCVDSSLPEGSYVALEVSDTGSGIAPHTLARIFDPFYTTKFIGRGLGLAAVQGIVRSHSGALSVTSTLGAGTTFRLLFSIAEAAATPPGEQRGDLQWKTSGRALVVDDEPALRLLGSVLLRKAGMEVDVAGDGQAGLDMLTRQAGGYQLVLLDLTMPRLDGRGALRAIRQSFPTLPVILVSGYTHDDIDSLLQLGGPTSFLHKPFTYRQLLKHLAIAMGHPQ